jgi:NAD+ synthase (glutamine-hydrolysing)
MANGFQEQILLTDLKTKVSIENSSSCEQLFKALSLGIKDYFIKTGHEKAVIGLSGGIDSALVACLAVDALGSNNVYLVSMPSRFSSDHSKSDAKKLASNLNSNFDTIDIDGLFGKYLDVLDGKFKGTESNVAEENIQSRIRGNILMAISNKFGYLVLSTGNKTELALGYCTLYGDMSGGLSAIGDLNKNEVYELSKWINQNKELIPENIISKEPSAELAPNQVDPFDYELISPTVDKIVFGDSNELDQQFLSLKKKININEHKRRQAAPVLRVSKKAFGIGRRIPIVNHFHE